MTENRNPIEGASDQVPAGRFGVLSAADPRHGTYNAYTNLHCRCRRCRSANNLYQLQRKDERRTEPIPPFVVHGKPATYSNWRCQCESCLAAWAAYCRRTEERRRAAQSA